MDVSRRTSKRPKRHRNQVEYASDGERTFTKPTLPKWIGGLNAGLHSYRVNLLPRAPGGQLHKRFHYDHQVRTTPIGWQQLESSPTDWPWRKDWHLGLSLAKIMALGVEGARLCRWVAVYVPERSHEDLRDALAHLGCSVTLEAHQDGPCVYFWLDGDYPAQEAREAVAGFLDFFAVGGWRIDKIQPLPGTQGYARTWGDPDARPFIKWSPRPKSRYQRRTGKRDHRGYLPHLVVQGRSMAVSLDKIRSFLDPHDRVVTSRDQDSNEPVDHRVRKEGEWSGAKREAWDRLDRDGVGAGSRWHDWKLWSFGWWIQNRSATPGEFEIAAREWWARTGGGRSRDAAENPEETQKEMARWARSRGRSIHAQIERGELIPGRVAWGHELTEDDERWVRQRAERLGEEEWMEELYLLGQFLKARGKRVAIHARNVLRRIAGRAYQPFRDAAERVFLLVRVGGYEVGKHAQRYEVGLAIGALDGPVDEQGRPFLLDLGRGAVAGWDWRGKLRAMWSWGGQERLVTLREVTERRMLEDDDELLERINAILASGGEKSTSRRSRAGPERMGYS